MKRQEVESVLSEFIFFFSLIDVIVFVAEKGVLLQADNEFVVKLHYSFQNQKFVFLVMDFMEGGMALILCMSLIREPK